MEPSATDIYHYEYEVLPDGRIRQISSSPELLTLVGFEESDFAAPDGWKKAIADEDRPTADGVLAETLAGGRWHGRLRVLTQQGSPIILELDQRVEESSDGRSIIRGAARNLTQQAQTEARLKEREARLRLLSNTIPLILWSTDRDLCFTWISGSGMEALGLVEDEVVGTSLQQFFDVEGGEFLPIAAHLRALKGEAVTYSIEWATRHYRVSLEPLTDETGSISGTIGIAVDVTDEPHLDAKIKDAAGEEVGPPGHGLGDDGSPATIDAGVLHIDKRTHRVTKGGRVVEVTPTEFSLLVELAGRPGEVLSRSELLQAVWGYDFGNRDSPLWMAIKRLRSKIEEDPSRPVWIETVRGVGYRFTPH